MGKQKYNKRHSIDDVWILGMVERDNKKRVLLFQVNNRTKSSLQIKIKKYV